MNRCLLKSKFALLVAFVFSGAGATNLFAGGDAILGTWEGKDRTRHLRITYSKDGKFKLENLRKPSRFAPLPPPRYGVFTYDDTSETLRLSERGSRQSFRLTWKGKKEFTSVNLVNKKRFVWASSSAPPTPDVGKLAGTTWVGSNGLTAGLATFVFMPKGKALYVGGGATKFGAWTATGKSVTLVFGTVTFSGKIGAVGAARVMTGTATDSLAMKKGSFTMREKK